MPKKKASWPALSFDLDDEGESFQVKKSKKPRSHKQLKTKDLEAPAIDTQVASTGTYTAEYMQQLRSQTMFKEAPSAVAADSVDNGGSWAVDTAAAQVVDAAETRWVDACMHGRPRRCMAWPIHKGSSS